MTFSLREIFEDLPVLNIVDVGASELEVEPIYSELLKSGGAQLTAFEPSPQEYERLKAINRPNTTILPHAVGDGSDATLHICQAPGMTSLLEPDSSVLEHFHRFQRFGTVLKKEDIKTQRLDDVLKQGAMDFLKIDIQGGELRAFQGAAALLEQTLVVHTEVQFVPFYKEQPLFGEIDMHLRGHDLWFHKFLEIQSRTFKPLMVDNDPMAGMSQELWSDAIYTRRFTSFKTLEADALLKIALIAHDFYSSYDLALLALRHVDEKTGRNCQEDYVRALAVRGTNQT